MNIEPILELNERKQKMQELYSQLPYPGDFAVQRFVSHLGGMEKFAMKKVLEIGGTDLMNMSYYFRQMEAEYSTVRIENNQEGHDYILPQNDYMKLDVEYGLVISLGVFEEYAIDRNWNGGSPFAQRRSNSVHLAKLAALTKEYCIVGTVSDPCLFSRDEIEKAGFELVHRQKPFYCLTLEGYPDYDTKSELVVMRK